MDARAGRVTGQDAKKKIQDKTNRMVNADHPIFSTNSGSVSTDSPQWIINR
jgi:hypothetical protein